MTRIAFRTDQGHRDTLEDAAGGAIVRLEAPELEIAILTIADGAGGHNAGEVASSICIARACSSLAARFAGGMAEGMINVSAPDAVVACLVNSLDIANRAVVEEAAGKPEL